MAHGLLGQSFKFLALSRDTPNLRPYLDDRIVVPWLTFAVLGLIGHCGSTRTIVADVLRVAGLITRDRRLSADDAAQLLLAAMSAAPADDATETLRVFGDLPQSGITIRAK